MLLLRSGARKLATGGRAGGGALFRFGTAARRKSTAIAPFPELDDDKHFARGDGARIVQAAMLPNALELTWDDESSSTFHHSWLRDHCPQSVHPVSHQKEVPLSTIQPDLAPTGVAIEEGARGQALRVTWPADADPTGTAHLSTFDSAWLRTNCYSRAAQREARSRQESPSGSGVTLWGAGVGELPAPVEWAALDRGGDEADATLLRLLRSLHEYGVGRVKGVPACMDATERLARMLAPVHETFYGGMWDTAPRELGEVIDTAYSNCELPLHTDGTYLQQTPGLQLFNCVAQPATVHARFEPSTHPDANCPRTLMPSLQRVEHAWPPTCGGRAGLH